MNGSDAARQFGLAPFRGCSDSLIALEYASFRLSDFLLDSLERKILLLFDALSKLEHCGEGEAKGHNQLGSASNCFRVSESAGRSSGPCFRKRLISGSEAIALSSTGSVPF